MPSDLVADTDRLFAAIGRVVVNFQFVESVVAEVLASLLQMKSADDSQRISAAMSYRQKVDLMCDLYPTRGNPQWPQIDLATVRQGLYVAEEFRNTVVHSFWHVGGNVDRVWMSSKANLRSASGFQIRYGAVDIDGIIRGGVALGALRDWYLGDSERLQEARATLKTVALSLRRQDGA